jgi:FAD/FMN-containing dehydrogenase
MRTLAVKTRARPRITLGRDVVDQLARAFRGELIGPADPGYEQARRVWNGMIDKHPALIARCTGAADVMAAVNFAREHDLLLSVRGGGHNVAGKALCDDGLVVDLSRMRAVRADPIRRIVQVQAGATLGDLDHETQAFGLAVPVGLVTATGIAGLTLHGGMGWLTRKYGLTLDNLVSMDVVTADGQWRKASDEENADLFWALRGGGGNFGVVTSFEFRAHPVGPEVWFGVTMYPISQAGTVVRFVRDFLREAPPELGVLATLWTAPDENSVPAPCRGAPVVIVLACYHGPTENGEKAIRPLRRIVTPLADLSGPRPFLEVQKFFDADYPNGRFYYWKSVYLEDMSDEVIAAAIDHAAQRPSPLTSLDLWFLEGAINQVPADRTAFARRDVKYGLAIESNWTDPAQSDANIAWSRRVFDDLQRFARGTYLNFPGFMEDADRLLQGAYGENYERLLAIKTAYDPDNLFRGVLNIVPAR